MHSSHVTRFSDSSLYDEVCINCGTTDNSKDRKEPCPLPPEKGGKTLDEYYNKPKPNVRVGLGTIIQHKNYILLHLRKGTHKPGHWASPGGHLEYGESWEQCALREIREECGPNLKIRELKYWHTVDTFYPEEKKHYITIFMRAYYDGGFPKIMEHDKCEMWEWFDWGNLPSPLMLGNLMMKAEFPTLNW